MLLRNAVRGERIYERGAACHSLDRGGARLPWMRSAGLSQRVREPSKHGAWASPRRYL